MFAYTPTLAHAHVIVYALAWRQGAALTHFPKLRSAVRAAIAAGDAEGGRAKLPEVLHEYIAANKLYGSTARL